APDNKVAVRGVEVAGSGDLAGGADPGVARVLPVGALPQGGTTQRADYPDPPGRGVVGGRGGDPGHRPVPGLRHLLRPQAVARRGLALSRTDGGSSSSGQPRPMGNRAIGESTHREVSPTDWWCRRWRGGAAGHPTPRL